VSDPPSPRTDLEPTSDPTIAVVGAGAAGFMAAIFAAGGPRVLLLERTQEGGKKILMSGGGRCNVLPSELDPARYVTASSPHTMKKILLSWPLSEQRAFFEGTLGMPLEREEETGKLFPISNRARDVRDRLRSHAEGRGVAFRGDAHVVALEPREPGWRIGLAGGGSIDASAVILATGGLSVPATGSDGGGLDIARRLGHTIHDLYPALTPLTARPHRHVALAGVSLPVTIHAPGAKPKFRATGGFLVTHKGYSGPAVLNASHLAILAKRRGGARQEFLVQWSPLDEAAWDAALRGGEGTVGALLRRHLPARLAETLLTETSVDPSCPLGQLTRDARRRLIETLTRYPLPWTGDEGYGKAEVTGGGVALDEVDPRTLESRRHSGLYLCGEILDAFGPIGGYNFAWAWATGRAAGTAARARYGA
jgi:predicted Rossmann fold flavoprotein